MPARYTLRMQFGFDWDPQVLGEKLLRVAREARVDEVAVFYFAEELNDGHETLERINRWIEHSRPWREALARAGITLALNPWHTVLHADRHRTLKPGQHWQTMVDAHGSAATACVCPLDPGWRAYYVETLRRYARAGFRVIWVDDDIRFHNHHPLEWGGCFCPLHVAEFNRRHRLAATREQIVVACLRPGEPHPWRSLWMDAWDATQREMIGQWRVEVEALGSRLGLMSSAMEQHAAEGRDWDAWWTAIAGDGPGVHRPHFWTYGDTMGTSLPGSLAMLQQNRDVQRAGVESGPEVECFVYGRWWKSFRQLHAQMALALTCGSNNLNISLYDFMGNDPDDEPQRAEFLRRWRGSADWLAEHFPMDLRHVGVGVPWRQDMGRRVRLREQGESWSSLVVAGTRWWANWLGSSGQAFMTRRSESINALAGEVAWSFDDDEVRRMLAGGLLLDGAAAEVLIDRGYAKHLGLTEARFVHQGEMLFAFEQCLDAAFALRPGARMSLNLHYFTPRLLQGRLLPGARMVSDVRGPTEQVVGHGQVVFANELGGRVAILPWTLNDQVVNNAQRHAQLTRTLAWLDPRNTRGWVEGGAWLVPQFLSNGRLWRAAVWNASPDEVDRFALHGPAGMPRPTAAVLLDARGERHNARVSGCEVVLPRPMQQWDLTVVW